MKALFHHPAAEWNGRARVFAAAAHGLGARGWDARFACCPDTEAHRTQVKAAVWANHVAAFLSGLPPIR